MEGSANGSVFPHRIVHGVADQPGRMAWCYGDPGMGAALWQTGLICGRTDWQSAAIDILMKATHRVRTRPNRIYDACLCHGTAGPALIFRKMFALTDIDEFSAAANHWLRATLDYAQHDQHPAGYAFLSTNNRYLPNLSLLEGIAGVGLVLNYFLDEEAGGWEAGLLL